MICMDPAASTAQREETAEALFQEYRRTRDPRIRDRLVLMHQGLVQFLAAKFAGRGEPLEDIVQIAWIGLIHAIDRFDPERGNLFSTYAAPTIIGEIQHYFRDRRSSLKIPRPLQELNRKLYQASETLCQELGRSPRIEEIAAHLDATEEEILEAMELADVRKMVSLDTELFFDGEASPLTIEDILGTADRHLESAESLRELKEAMARLDRRERRILYLRFFEGYSQNEVASRLNLSQMHISRLQRRALERLRALLSEPGEEGAGEARWE